MKLAVVSSSTLPLEPAVAVPRSGVMSLVLGNRSTPKVTSKWMFDALALKLAPDPSRTSFSPARPVSLRRRSPMLAFRFTPGALKLSFLRRNVSAFVVDE